MENYKKSVSPESDSHSDNPNKYHESSTNIETPDHTETFGIGTPNVLAIKGKFKFPSNGIYGIFAFLFNMDTVESLYKNGEPLIEDKIDNKNNPTIYTNILASYFSDLYYTDTKESWATLEDTFNALQINAEYAQSITSNFKKVIQDVLVNSNAIPLGIVHDYMRKNKLSIEKEINNLLTQVYQERSIEIEISFEELIQEDLEFVKKHRIVQEQPEDNKDAMNTPFIEVNPLDFQVPAKPILAPVGEGIPAYQLSSGIRILMKIDNNDYGKHWIDMYKLSDKTNNTLYPIVGTVEQIGPVIKNTVDILVKYQPNQYTKFNIESGVKLKLYNPTSSEAAIDPISSSYEPYRNQEIKKLSELFNDFEFRMMIMIGIGLAVLALLSLYFIYN